MGKCQGFTKKFEEGKRVLFMKGVLGALLLGALAMPSCASKGINYDTLNSQANTAVTEAENLIQEGKYNEGAKLLHMVKELHPNDPKINSAMGSIPEEIKKNMSNSPMLGINKKAMRAKSVATVGKKILLYIPDRIKDFLDMFTVEVNVGPQIGAGAWVTRAVQVNAYAGATAGGGIYQKTGIGFEGDAGASFAIGPVGGESLAAARAGTFGVLATSKAVLIHKPSHPLYQNYRDYWSVGGKLGLAVVGAEAEFHVVEAVDFIAGLFLIDLLTDDWATTEKLQYTKDQNKMLKGLGKSISKTGEKELIQYRELYPSLATEKTAFNM